MYWTLSQLLFAPRLKYEENVKNHGEKKSINTGYIVDFLKLHDGTQNEMQY